MRKLYDLDMKETNSGASHLNINFVGLWSQLQAQKLTMDELKYGFLFYTMATSSHIFCIAIIATEWEIGLQL